MVPYSIQPANFSLNQIKSLIQSRDLLPSRSFLKVDLDNKFERIDQIGIKNLKQLNAAFINNEMPNLALKLGIQANYLVILKREANSFISKPVKLSTFPDIKPDLIQNLGAIGIHSSKLLFEEVQKQGLKKFTNDLKCKSDNLIELFSLCDLVRIWGVGSIFARIIFESGIVTVSDFVKTDPVLAYKLFIETNTRLKLTKASFIENDIVFCNRMAKELEPVDFNHIINS